VANAAPKTSSSLRIAAASAMENQTDFVAHRRQFKICKKPVAMFGAGRNSEHALRLTSCI
jgi:hypothetical protein